MTAAALLIALIACVLDLRTRRIPNVLTLGGALAGVAVGGLVGGWAGAGHSLLGWSVGLALFLPVFLLRGMGAGDVKLLACLGAWLGAVGVLWTALFTAMAGAVLALGLSLTTGYTRRAFKNIWLMLTHWAVLGIRPLPELTLDDQRRPRLAYALPMMVGAVVATWLHS